MVSYFHPSSCQQQGRFQSIDVLNNLLVSFSKTLRVMYVMLSSSNLYLQKNEIVEIDMSLELPIHIPFCDYESIKLKRTRVLPFVQKKASSLILASYVASYRAYVSVRVKGNSTGMKYNKGFREKSDVKAKQFPQGYLIEQLNYNGRSRCTCDHLIVWIPNADQRT